MARARARAMNLMILILRVNVIIHPPIHFYSHPFFSSVTHQLFIFPTIFVLCKVNSFHSCFFL